MGDLTKLPLWADEKEGILNAVVETCRGQHVKLRYDPEIGTFTISHALPMGHAYPHDWGFFPSTRAEDGDPLDVLILHDFDALPGLVVPCRAIGVLEVMQTEASRSARNDRVFAVPTDPNLQTGPRHIEEMPATYRKGMERFFAASVTLQDKRLEFLGWFGPERALECICRCQEAFSARH